MSTKTPPSAETTAAIRRPRPPLRFDRHEWSGAFGDMGTDLPLLVGMILAARLDSASVLTVFGMMQVFTGLWYRMPMPVQPLKAMAALIIAQKLPAAVVYGGGLAIGVVMLLLTLSGAISWVARIVPKPVVRGIQFGLGLQLASIALREYVRADGRTGWALAAAGFVLTLWLMRRPRFPSALALVGLGLAYAFTVKLSAADFLHAAGFRLPQVHAPGWPDIWTGFLVLSLPQLPLSLANSVLATRQVAADLFPERAPTVRQIGFTYSLMNLVNPFLGGVPTCHGSGGMAGHYAFGGRTGGSVVIYGSIYAALGLFFSAGFQKIIEIFPLPVLGILLLFESLTLLLLVRDVAPEREDFAIAALVGLSALLLPYGYVIGMVAGTLLHHAARRGWISFAR
ncbi:MAG: putative sulfate/molybdate transporter [Bryobacteraceae bacterium]